MMINGHECDIPSPCGCTLIQCFGGGIRDEFEWYTELPCQCRC